MADAKAAVPSPLTIGEVAAAAEVNVQTLRYYERVRLLPLPKRSRSGYRLYGEDAVRLVRFVKRAQELGFTLREIKQLLALRTARSQKRDAVRAAASAKVVDIDARIARRKIARTRLTLYRGTSRRLIRDGKERCTVAVVRGWTARVDRAGFLAVEPTSGAGGMVLLTAALAADLWARKRPWMPLVQIRRRRGGR